MEAAGLAIGGIALSSLFEQCLSLIDRIDSGRNCSKSYQDLALQMTFLGARLDCCRVTWQQKEISGTEKQGLDAKACLTRIKDRLEEAQATGERYQITSNEGTADTSDAANIGKKRSDKALAQVTEKFRRMLTENREGVPLLDAYRWALRDEAKLQKLVETVTRMVQGLEALFPAFAAQLDEIAKKQAEMLRPQRLEEPEEVVKEVAAVISDVDERLSQHIYKNMEAFDEAEMTVGNYVSEEAAKSGWKESQGGRHSYDNVVARGKSRVFAGNVVGGRSPFERR